MFFGIKNDVFKDDIEKKKARNIKQEKCKSIKTTKNSDLRQLFKKIASVVHPDKLVEKSDFESPFSKVRFFQKLIFQSLMFFEV